ncbi:hypothetical protein [Clostridium gasigenes]|uniref:Uncharacterized protein n=1 Tax=Clostridium gasigenes TaxID=94869 RepID=A0A7X0VRA3_9CLOT|nr:hypothetical protein [Clostridium gasigenes]MBB6714783.1 hypothetical protein [Clostridium gasigenes]
MEMLTTTILSGMVWDIIKGGGKLTADYLKKKLKAWILEEESYQVITSSINDASDNDKKSIKYLDAYIDSDDKIKEILKTATPTVGYMQDNNSYIGSVNATGNKGTQTITINNGGDIETKK